MLLGTYTQLQSTKQTLLELRLAQQQLRLNYRYKILNENQLDRGKKIIAQNQRNNNYHVLIVNKARLMIEVKQ